MPEQAVSIDPKQQRDQNRRPGGRRPERGSGAPREEKIFNEHVVSIDRVARVVKGGRRFRFKALVAVGDGKQRVGVGVSKGADVQTAITKAADKAKKQLLTIPVVKATIPHDATAKVGGAKVLLMPAAPGTGIIAGGAVRSIIGLTGITNLLAKTLGSSNKVNTAYATMDALRQLVPQEQWLNPPAKKSAAKPAAKIAATTTEKK